MAHGAPGRVFHLAILEVIARAREEVVVAAVVVVQMADDDGFHAGGVDADGRKTFRHRLDRLAAAARADHFVKPGIDQNGARLADNRPHEVVERHLDVVRVAAEKILRRLAWMVAVANGIDLVEIAHVTSPMTSAADLKFLRHLPQSRPGTSNRKAALESYI
jgi:hypothetical protein